ncbi:hypothetical protein D3C84_793890 [compost metagenome]
MPTRSSRRPGLRARNSAAAKYTSVYSASGRGWLPAKGATPISNDTTAVRGVANSGPMDRYTATANSNPARRPSGAVSCAMPPPTRASATTVSSGRPTPVIRKPSAALHTASPAARPALGGKMMLPAPRNNAKVMKPRASTSAVFRWFMHTTREWSRNPASARNEESHPQVALFLKPAPPELISWTSQSLRPAPCRYRPASARSSPRRPAARRTSRPQCPCHRK